MSSASPTAHEDYCIALYYLYAEIPNGRQHLHFQTQVCESWGLTGRIRVAREGINGVLSGRKQHLEEYERVFLKELQTMHPQLRRNDVDFKYCPLRTDLTVGEQLFPTLLAKETKTVIGLVDTPPSSSSLHRASRKTKKRGSRPPLLDEVSDAALVRHVYERAMEQFARETASSSSAFHANTDDHNPVREEEVSSMQVPHLSPLEWDRRVKQLTGQPEHAVVFLDCRNGYESNIGHFRSPQAQTILTNTRKFSELPQVLVEQSEQLARSTHIFAYCTGGVRCERATVFLKGLLRERHPDRPQPEIFQLRGGIQRYLEHSTTTTTTTLDDTEMPLSSSQQQQKLYQGKNFVFDPRRVDPMHTSGTVGHCLVCHDPHDDYDNGHPPASDRAARCWNCRVLILVCNACRTKVSCWGDDDGGRDGRSEDQQLLPRMYCGGPDQECWHRHPVQVLTDESNGGIL